MSTTTTTTAVADVENIISTMVVEGQPVFDLYRDVPEEHWRRAAAFVPDVPVEGSFIDRDVFGRSGVQHVVDAIVLSENIMVCGHAGSGKSTLIEYVCGLLRLPYLRVDCSPNMSIPNLMGRSTVGGLMTDRDDVQGWLEGDLLFAARHLPGVVLFDEINRMDAVGATELMSITSEARTLSVPEANLPTFKAKTLMFAATANPPSYAGTFEVDEAVARRFVKLPWGYDRPTEDVLIGSETLLDVAWAVRAHTHIRSILPTSTLLRFQKKVRYHGDAEAALGFLLEDFTGIEKEVIETTIDGRIDMIVAELKASS
ncbi:AAA family ATPase [Ilumatobacter sp.]|uniref:AAA family ATPase n=1 Tax=Ilumatobacter sp. TaxID=1967498 RepID=UPI0037509DF6